MTQIVSTTTSEHMKAAGHTEKRRIIHALFSLASAALLIRVMGLLNQVIVTGRFGAGARMDAYVIASTLPLLLAQLIANAIEASVIPAYARVRTHGTKQEASILFSTLLNLLFVGAAILTIVLLLFRSELVSFTAPGSQQKVIALAIELTPFIFPVLLLMIVINYLECILNTEGQFGWPAYAGMLVPIATAVLVYLAGKQLGIVMLCVGMVAGLCLQLSVFIFRAKRANLVYRPVIKLHLPEIRTVFTAAWPVLIGALISQAGPLVDQMFASFLAPGSISALSYALKLVGIFSGVIFVSVGRAILPYLSRQAAAKNLTAFKDTLRLYLWIVGIFTTVLSIMLWILAHPLVQLLFQRGSFTAADTNRTATTVIGFVVGLTPMAFGFIAFRAYSALGQTRMLLRFTLFTVVANSLFDLVFSHFWQSQGIALATSAVYICNMFLMFFTLRRQIGELHLFTPPIEIVEAVRVFGRFLSAIISRRSEAVWWIFPYSLRIQFVRSACMLVVFSTGVAGIFLNSLYAVRASLGSVALVALMRYRYALLILWALINGPNSMPIFRGSNVLIGLTVPTLLVMPGMPIKQTIRRFPALGFLTLFLVWVLAGVAISPIGVGPFLTAWVEMLDCVAVGILTLDVLTTKRRLTGLIDMILLVGLGISLYGIYGYITKQNGLLDPTTSVFRIISIFAAAPGLAMYLSVIIPLAIYRMFISRGIIRILSLITTLIFLVAATLTYTRSTFISIPLSMIVIAFFVPSRKLKRYILGGMVALSLIVIVLAFVGNIPILSRFANTDISTFNGRTFLWQAIVNNFDPTQLLGNGLRASDTLLAGLHIGVNNQGIIGTSPHDLFLGTLFDSGVIGLLLLVTMFISLVVCLVKGMLGASGEHRMLFAVALAMLINVLLQSLDSNDFWNQSISIYIWVIMVLPFAPCWARPQPEKLDEPDTQGWPTEDYDDEPTEPRLPAIRPVKQREPVPV